MIGARRAKRAADFLDAEHIGQKTDQLEGLGGEAPSALAEPRIVGEQFGVMLDHHAGAGAGRRDDIIERLERRHHLQREGAGARLVAGVKGRLAATGLRRNLDMAPAVLQQFDGGEADRRAEQIDQTGGEQRGAGAGA